MDHPLKSLKNFFLVVGIVVLGVFFLKHVEERDLATRAQSLSIQEVIYSDNLNELDRRLRDEGASSALGKNVESIIIDLGRDEELAPALRMILDNGGVEVLTQEIIDHVYLESARWRNIEAMKAFSGQGLVPSPDILSEVDSSKFDREILEFFPHP